jgi:hypothetical protein
MQIFLLLADECLIIVCSSTEQLYRVHSPLQVPLTNTLQLTRSKHPNVISELMCMMPQNPWDWHMLPINDFKLWWFNMTTFATYNYKVLKT